MSYKILILTCLISSHIHPTPPQLTDQEEFALEQQQEKDAQELKLKIIALVGTLSLAIIAGLVQIYVNKK